MKKIIKIGILKSGCIGVLPILEFLLDERAERTDIEVLVVGSGSKIGINQTEYVAHLLKEQKPDLALIVGPGQSTSGPSQSRRILLENKIRFIVISDSPAKKIIQEIEEEGGGYIIVEGDSMIGARREFLDLTEMVLFNSDLMRVLASTGTYSLLAQALDNIIKSLELGEEPELPRLVITGDLAIKTAKFANPYAEAKAFAAYELSRNVSNITTKACFKVKDPQIYIPMVAAAHEMMRAASKLADEARELEKGEDQVLRIPHFKDGGIGIKRRLKEKPRKV